MNNDDYSLSDVRDLVNQVNNIINFLKSGSLGLDDSDIHDALFLLIETKMELVDTGLSFLSNKSLVEKLALDS